MSIWGDHADRLRGVDPRLVGILELARERSGIPFGISEGLRDAERQKQMVAQGKSQTMNSRHLTGNAVDIHIPDGKGGVNWDFDAYRPIADAAKAAAQELGYEDFVWGGDWKTLKDGVHFQIGGNHAGHNHGGDTQTGGLSMTPRSEPDLLGAEMQTPQEQPRGLLGRVREAIAPKDGGGLLGGWLTPDVRDRLTLALEGMTLNPNQGLIEAAKQNMAGRAEAEKAAQAEQQTAEQRNRTAEWLMRQGREDLAQAVAGGFITGRDAFEALNAQPEDGRTASIKDYEYARANGYGGSFDDFRNAGGRGDVNVNVDTGARSSQWGEPPKDMTWATDAEGNTLTEQYDLGGGRTAQRPVAIPLTGTKADETASDLEKGRTNAISQATMMLGTIDSVLNDSALGYATGKDGFLAHIPSTGAYRARTKVDQLQGQVFLEAYERLKGGGVITEIEGQKAERALARLDRGLGDEDFKAALMELREVVDMGLQRAKKMGGGGRVADMTDEDLMNLYGGD